MIPESMLGPDWAPLWENVRAALDDHRSAYRGRVELPVGLPPSVRRRLQSLVGREVSLHRRHLNLGELEQGLLDRHDTDLLGAVDAAGLPPPSRGDARLERSAVRRARNTALDEAAGESLGGEDWITGWVAQVRPGIVDDAQARRAVDVVARVLGEADPGTRRSRTEVAARVLDGGAHRLDRSTPERGWVRAALAHRAGAPERDDPSLWGDAGLPGDLVSKPALTWALPLSGDGVPAAVRALTEAGAPAPLTTMTIHELEVVVDPGVRVLSVENPRLLEGAVQRALPAPVVCTHGRPTHGVVALLGALVAAGARVVHHGDIDPAGLDIAGYLRDRGVEPWRMGLAEYRAALARAEADGVELPRIEGEVPETPWEPALADEVRRVRLAVEEERVMDALLAEHAREVGGHER